MDNPEKLTTQSTQDTGQINVREYQRGNQKRTIQRNWQHKVHRTNKCQRIPKGQSKKDNPEKLATQGTQDTEQINVREYRRDNKKDIPEKLATQGTQDTRQINFREYRRGKKKGQSRETGNIGYTRHRTNKCQRIPKGQYKRTIQRN